MPEENKPKATLIKQSRNIEQNTPAQAKPEVATEKKKIVIIKKKPVVVVKAQPTEEPKVETKPAEVSPAAAPAAAATAAPAAEAAPKAEPAPSAPAKSPAQAQAAAQTPYRRPVIGGAPVVQKKVVKKTNIPQSTINMGPVIISGDNLPPINPNSETRPAGTSRPVGSVGGVTYGRDGQRIPNNYNRGAQGGN